MPLNFLCIVASATGAACTTWLPPMQQPVVAVHSSLLQEQHGAPRLMHSTARLVCICCLDSILHCAAYKALLRHVAASMLLAAG
jgi:hypothetical protein